MHFIAVLYHKTARSFETPPSNIDLRGYNPRTWIPAELAHIKLPVYALAYAPCPTFRDIYLDRVRNIDIPFTWNRYKGRVVDFIYKNVHKTCLDYMTECRARTFNLFDLLNSKQDELIEAAKTEYQRDYEKIDSLPSQPEINRFYDSLKKIVRFEAELVSSTINFEISRNKAANPNHIFAEHFDFNTDYSLNPRHQGFTSPATPDFIFRHKVIGDIKTGSWKTFFEFTATAYALAYEDHSNQNMDYGVIMNVELPRSRLIPVHYEVGIEHLDDRKRERFIALRNRKLEIVNSKTDPGRPERRECTLDCPFLYHCWGNGD